MDAVKGVAYLRVSTEKQGSEGDGIDAQRAEVAAFAKQYGYEVTAEFVEVESGKRSDRPVLAEALKAAKKTGSTLLISRLDRLARNVHFVSGLMESKVEFRVCNLPVANALLLHVMSAVAQAESLAVSERTRAAMQAAKARGARFGAHRSDGYLIGGQTTRARAREAYDTLAPTIRELRTSGLSLSAIARRLNDSKSRTRNGKPWTPTQVSRVLSYSNV
jgi:DNA invertase Pin-like site-specific DNA recombinase